MFHYYFIQALSEYYNVHVATTCADIIKIKGINIFLHPSRLFKSNTLAIYYHHVKCLLCSFKNIDLIHVPYTSKLDRPYYHLILIKHLLRKPYVLRIHGGGMHYGKSAFLHQALFDHAAGIIAVSSPVKKEYEKRHGKQIKMIPSMLPFKSSFTEKTVLRKNYGLSAGDIVVLFVGTLKKIKGPDILLSAFMNLGKDYIKKNSLKLVFAGEGPMKRELIDKVETFFCSSHVIFLGHVKHEKISEIYESSDLFVIPSLMEARPLSLSEAFFHGVPAIGSDIPTIGNIIGHNKNGLLFKSGNITSLEQQLRVLIENKTLRIRFGQKAKESYRLSYRYDEMLQEYLKFYQNVLSRS